MGERSSGEPDMASISPGKINGQLRPRGVCKAGGCRRWEKDGDWLRARARTRATGSPLLLEWFDG